MKTFKFKFETLLDFRKNMEDLLKREFSFAKDELNKKEKELEELMYSYINEIEGMLEKGEITSAEMDACRNYIESLKESVDKKRKTIGLIRAAVQEKQNELLTARKHRKVMDFLKDKEIKGHKMLEGKEEQFFIDEYNSNTFKNRGDL
ncbi:MAG: flagellar export protein FliJ [Deltaproteobacteria bacterium]|nr:flagellar export protein FliJ [Deltaproteobacteria bacterium]